MKTSIMRELFNVYMPKKDRLTSIQSTEGSLHLMTEKAYDYILAVDDFKREGSQAEVKIKAKTYKRSAGRTLISHRELSMAVTTT